MIKKILLMTAISFFSLHAADENSVVTLSAMQKKDLLLDYMFTRGFVDEIVPYIKPYNIIRKIASLQELCRLYQPGQQAYALAKATCRDICHIIQRSSSENKETIIRLFVRYNVEPVVQCKLHAVKQSLETSGPAREQIKTQFTCGIKNFLNVFYLQQSLEIPWIEDEEFDSLYQEKMEQTLKHLSRAVIFQGSFEVEEPQIVKDLLAQHNLDSQELDGFVAIAFQETEEILQVQLKQYDPHCGI